MRYIATQAPTVQKPHKLIARADKMGKSDTRCVITMATKYYNLIVQFETVDGAVDFIASAPCLENLYPVVGPKCGDKYVQLCSGLRSQIRVALEANSNRYESTHGCYNNKLILSLLIRSYIGDRRIQWTEWCWSRK
jgi:hypothetical protein